MFCLPKNIANVFLEKLKIGEINPEMLTKLSSEERRAYFSEFMGDENAKQVNTLLESKLILKNQQTGIINWAKQVSGLKPEVVSNLVTRVNKMDAILKPENEKAFLADLAEHKLGTAVTMEEAANISELARITSEAKQKWINGTGDRMTYGRARIAFRNYVGNLKRESSAFTLEDYKNDPVQLLMDSANNAKAASSSLDDSGIGRQGWKTIFTHPRIWANNAVSTFSYIWKTLGGKEVLDEIDADIISRPNYDKMVTGGLAVNTKEDPYPETWVHKIPAIGKLFKASDAAFTGFAHKTRADIFDFELDVANKTGVDTNDVGILKNISQMINSLTGRGFLGRFEPAADFLNFFMYSPRLIKSHLDTLALHPLNPKFDPYTRRRSAINLIRIISGIAATKVIANAISPGSSTYDTKSADVGKIKVGKTRFDISGGMSPLAVLASRLTSRHMTSSKTGRVYSIDSKKYGAIKGDDLVHSFFENKLSPAGTVLLDVIKQEDRNKKNITFLGEAGKLVTPLSIRNFLESKDQEGAADILAIILADALGIGTNTY